MAKLLLLTGPKRVGKSTAIQRIIATVGGQNFAGFYTRERRNEVRRSGFDIVMLDGRVGGIASIDSDSPMRVGREMEGGRLRYGVTLEFLDSVAVPAIEEAARLGERVLVMDEIGPMQVYSQRFTKAVEALFGTDVLVLGTIVERSTEWTDALKSRPDVETFGLTPQNRDTMTEMMALYIGRMCSTGRGGGFSGPPAGR